MTKHPELWAVTSYFNPAKYRARLENFHKFRDALDVKLLVVEFDAEGRFELAEGDADGLVQVAGGSVLWQKERLLNHAVSRLPPEATHVAWLDCDIAFADRDWPSQALALLAEMPAVQLFSHVVDLEPGEGIAEARGREPNAIAFVARRQRATEVLPPSIRRIGMPGFAWAASRSLLERHGLYEANVIGSGDRAWTSSLFGCDDDVVSVSRYNEVQRKKYIEWALPLRDEVQGRVGCLPGLIYHFWHGALQDRRYMQRSKEFAAFDFDPNRDIAVGETGALEWSSAKPAMHAYVRDYFLSRREDG